MQNYIPTKYPLPSTGGSQLLVWSLNHDRTMTPSPTVTHSLRFPQPLTHKPPKTHRSSMRKNQRPCADATVCVLRRLK